MMMHKLMKFLEMTMTIHFKRSELYSSKGQLTLSLQHKDSQTINNELNETLAQVLTQKYLGDNTDANTQN